MSSCSAISDITAILDSEKPDPAALVRSTLELEACEPLPDGGGLVHLRSRVRADRHSETQDVLDWRFVGVMA